MKEVSVVSQLGERDTVQLGVGDLGSAPQTPVHHKVLQFPGIFRPEEHDFANDVLKVEKGASGS